MTDPMTHEDALWIMGFLAIILGYSIAQGHLVLLALQRILDELREGRQK